MDRRIAGMKKRFFSMLAPDTGSVCFRVVKSAVFLCLCDENLLDYILLTENMFYLFPKFYLLACYFSILHIFQILALEVFFHKSKA